MTRASTNMRFRAAVLAGLAALILSGAYLARNVLVPFALSVVIAYVLDPAVDALDRRGVSRTWGILILLAGFSLAAAGLFALIVPELVRQIDGFLGSLPAYMARLREQLAPVYRSLQERYPAQMEAAQAQAMKSINDLIPGLMAPIIAGAKFAFSSLLGAVLWLVMVLFVPVFTFYLLHDFPAIRIGIVSLVPTASRPAFVAKVDEIDGVLRRWLRGQLTVAVILAIIYGIGLPLLHVPLGLLLGIAGGLANVVPYLGLVVGMVPAMLLVFLDSGEWIRVAGVAALFAGAHLLEGTVISPRIVGQGVGLRPVVVLLAVLVGGEIFGFTGVLLAVPFTAAAMVFVRDAKRAYTTSGFFAGARGAPAFRLPLRRRRPVA
jgi:predicted PurR-regulated permease PerM